MTGDSIAENDTIVIMKARSTRVKPRKVDAVDSNGLDWKSLYGSGKGLLNGEDAQAYVDKGRKNRTFSTFRLGVKKDHLKRSKIS